MSWFNYGKPRKRSWRKGVHLKITHLPIELRNFINTIAESRTLAWVEVCELQPKGFVLLECWCYDGVCGPGPGVEIYRVFHVRWQEDESWVCEGDQGRGCVESK